MMRHLGALIVCLGGLLPTASCGGVECGEGTFAMGDNCVGFDPDDKTPPVTTASPSGGRTRAPLPEVVTLTTDEPAKIFYTTDGSEPDVTAVGGETSPVTILGVTQGTVLKVSAVDRAGNVEPTASIVFDSDSTPPAPVSGMTVVMNGTASGVAPALPEKVPRG